MFPVDYRRGVYPPPPGASQEEWGRFRLEMSKAHAKNEAHIYQMAWLIGSIGVFELLFVIWLFFA